MSSKTDTILNVPTALAEPEGDSDNLPDAPNREERFIQNLFVCQSTTEAAVKAGYSESYAVSSVRVRLKNPKFLDKIREYARAHELIDSIPKILQIEDKALKYLANEGTKATEIPKFAALLKQKKQLAGLLAQDAAPQAPVIDIREVGKLMLNVYQNAPDNGCSTEPQRQGDDIIDIK